MTDATTNRVEVYDTTLRDGTQAQGVSFSLRDKLEIAQVLDELGVDYIEGGYPLSNPKDEQFFQEASGLNLKNAKITAFGMTRRKGIKAEDDTGMQALLGSAAPVVTIVGKSWELHVRDVLRVSEDENLSMITDSLEIMAKSGRKPFYDAEHFFDGFKDNEEFAMRTLRAAVNGGAKRLILCDTNGGSTVDDIARITQTIAETFPHVPLGIHCHNDSGLAAANSIAAVLHGARQVQGTINGIGERCGNADLITIIANLALKHGFDVLQPDSLEQLTKTSRFIYEMANMNFRDNQPFVGSGAFAHKGGMHVHAVQRNTETYEHIDPALVGNSRRILVSELGGRSNIAATVPAKFGLADDRDAQAKILQGVMDMENAGYEFEAAEASFEMLVRRILGGTWYKDLWSLDHYRCVILKRDAEAPNTEAIVKLAVNERVNHTVAEGDGPVDSLFKALSAALRDTYPHVDNIHLMDYRVRVVNTAAETAARVRVVIEWRDAANGSYFGSVGVSENIIDASWLALIDAIEYKLLNEQDKNR
ncbi:MAG: citramalate synthase [Phycisphaerae bacterium]|nr:citramalate synthase [Phycisphaerae bacterium]